MKTKGLKYLWIAALVFAVDQITKFCAVTFLLPYEPVKVLSFFNLTLAFNPGAAFSFLVNYPKLANVLFIVIAAVASVVILILLNRKRFTGRLESIGLCFVLGGALGNVFDRVRTGFVVDFLDFHAGAWHWPVFNVADIGVCLGVFLLIVHYMREQSHSV